MNDKHNNQIEGSRTMVTINTNDITNVDNLDRPLIHYSIAKPNGIRAGVIFNTESGQLKAVEYIDWNPRTNRRFSGFACVEVH
jgi:hypothetical protein